MYNKKNVKELLNKLGIKVVFDSLTNLDNCFEMWVKDKNDIWFGNRIFVWNGVIVSKKEYEEKQSNYFKNL